MPIKRENTKIPKIRKFNKEWIQWKEKNAQITGEHMKKEIKTIGEVAAWITGGMLGASYILYRMVVLKTRLPILNPPLKGQEVESSNEREQNLALMKSCTRRDITIRSYDGLKLHGSYYPGETAKRIVICVHGYRARGEDNFCGEFSWLHKECDLLLIDQRACGKSEGKHITFGAKEKRDLKNWIDYVAANNPDDLPVYLYGVSMGASTVMNVTEAALPKCVAGVIADCGYSSMKEIIASCGWRGMHIPPFPFVSFVNFFCRWLALFDMKESNSKKALSHSKLPVIFIHGTADDFVLPENSLRNYAACRSEKEMIWIDGAGHGCAHHKSPQKYEKAVDNFFARHDAK